MNAHLGTTDQRALFEAVRRRVFAEMAGATSRKRLVLFMPIQLLVVGVLVVYGAPSARIAIQIAADVVTFGAFRLLDRPSCRRPERILGLALASILVSVANTGGLASPLLAATIPFLFMLGISPELTRRGRLTLFAGFGAGLVAMAGLAHTKLGVLFSPLAQTDAMASSAFIALSLLSCLMVAITAFKMGCKLTVLYERIAIELAVRREELCDESEGRTRALEGIAARLAHEVKNPLAAIKGLSTHVARNATDAKVAERLTIVAAEAERLQEIVDGFLSFSRGLDDLHVERVKPYELSHELSLLLETRAAEAGVSIEVKGSRELTLDADGKKLRQALLNLVLNAVQASERDTTITIEIAKYVDGAAQIKVIDHGTGMSAQVLARIEKPYFTTRDGGSGLGIAIARGIIEQHGGKLQFESAEGRGTVALIELPAMAIPCRSKLPNPCRGMAKAATELLESAPCARPACADADKAAG